MKPEEKRQFDALIREVETMRRQLDEALKYIAERKVQQLTFPLDDGSLQAIFENQSTMVATGTSASSLTQSYADSGGDNVVAPKAYTARLIVVANGVTYHLAALAVV